LQEMAKIDADRRDRWKLNVSILALCISVASALLSGSSLWLNYFQCARLEISAGETLLINGQSLIGASFTFTNTGARPKVINHVEISIARVGDTASTIFEVRSVSPSLSSWTYDDKTGSLVEQTNIVHSSFDAFEVPGRGETHETIWFLPSDSQFRFASEEYSMSVRGFGEGKDDLAVHKCFAFRIEKNEFNTFAKHPDQLRRITFSQWR
jgi:hypothetical protein